MLFSAHPEIRHFGISFQKGSTPMETSAPDQTFVLEADLKALYRVQWKKMNQVILTVLAGILLMAGIMVSRGELSLRALLVLGGTAIVLLLLIAAVMFRNLKRSSIQLTIRENTLVLNGRHALDYAPGGALSCILRSGNGKYWYFIKDGQTVHTEYFEIYPELLAKAAAWLQADFEPDGGPRSSATRGQNLNRLLADAFRTLFSQIPLEPEAVAKMDAAQRRRFITVRKVLAAWNIFWALLLPLCAELGIAALLSTLKLDTTILVISLLALVALFAGIQIVCLLISQPFLKPFINLINRCLKTPPKE
jgi:hypothetical protein